MPQLTLFGRPLPDDELPCKCRHCGKGFQNVQGQKKHGALDLLEPEEPGTPQGEARGVHGNAKEAQARGTGGARLPTELPALRRMGVWGPLERPGTSMRT